MNKKRLLLILTILCLGTYLKLTEVSLEVTKTDAFYIDRILSKKYPHHSEIGSFSEELEVIQSVVKDVHQNITPGKKGITYGKPREPKDLYTRGYGACFDLSRTIEKTLRSLGFTIRHVATYKLENRGVLRTLLTPGIPSHSTSEILTKEGWMILDPHTTELALDWNGKPISIERAAREPENAIFKSPHRRLHYYQSPFTYLYGLYSRHGKFYSPYTFIPDVNYGEMLRNFF